MTGALGAMASSAALIRSGAKNRLAYFGAFVARNLFIIVILYVFQALWKKVYAGRDALGGFTVRQIVWYLVITESVVLGHSRLWMTVQDEMKDGTVAYGLTRPVPYPRLTVLRFLGEGLVGLPPIAMIAGTVALIAVGPLRGAAAGIPAATVLMVGSLVLAAQMEMLIGLAAFVLEDVTPLFWIQQKVIFIFGGMFFPIDLYPEVLAAVLKALPFAYVCYWPGTVAVRGGEGFAAALAGQAGWIIATGLLVRLAYCSAVRRIESTGG